jgi:hypothetical protein
VRPCISAAAMAEVRRLGAGGERRSGRRRRAGEVPRKGCGGQRPCLFSGGEKSRGGESDKADVGDPPVDACR